MATHRSGKLAYGYLKRVGADYAIQAIVGLDTDGRPLASSYDFAIENQTEEATGYGVTFAETVPLGMSSVSDISLESFWNSASGGLNRYLRTMQKAQHENAACTDPASYYLVLIPEGKCDDREYWRFSGTVIKNYTPNTPMDGLLKLSSTFGVWTPESGYVEQVAFDISVAAGSASPAPTDQTVENALYDYFHANINADTDFTQAGFDAYLATTFPNIGSTTWTAPAAATTSVAAAGNILIPGTISVTIT